MTGSFQYVQFLLALQKAIGMSSPTIFFSGISQTIHSPKNSAVLHLIFNLQTVIYNSILYFLTTIKIKEKNTKNFD